MIIKVHPHYLELVENETTNEKESYVSDFTFEFDDEITDDFTKIAYFTKDGVTYQKVISNNKVDYAPEVLTTTGNVEIGVSCFKVENNKTIRYNPTPITKYIEEGSLRTAQNSEDITPTDKEQIEQAITNLENNKQDTLTAGDNITIESNVISATTYDDSEIKSDISSLQNTKQNTLVSGENIKTINNQSLLGSGNIDIQGGGSSDYEELTNLPKINNVELKGNKTTSDLGIIIPTQLSQLSDDSTHRLTTDSEKTTWNNKSNFSGSYNDLSNKPTIPTKTSDLTNDSDFVTTNDFATSSTPGVVKMSDTNAVTTGSTGNLVTQVKTYQQYTAAHDYMFIGKGTLENVIAGKNLATTSDVNALITASTTDISEGDPLTTGTIYCVYE